MILDATRSADALAFLRASLTPAEQQWPRFEPTLRAIRDVPIGELRTHPDLVERVVLIAPAREHVWMLMGAPVLVTQGGAVYGFGFGMRTLGLRAGGSARGFERVETTTPPSTGSRVVVLNDEWISVDPWMVKSSKADGIATLKALASTALGFVDR
jgi:hypothetical protein